MICSIVCHGQKKTVCVRGKSGYDRLCRAARAPHSTPPHPTHATTAVCRTLPLWVRPPPFLLPFGGDFSCRITGFFAALLCPVVTDKIFPCSHDPLRPTPFCLSVCLLLRTIPLLRRRPFGLFVGYRGPANDSRGALVWSLPGSPARQPAGCLLPLASVFVVVLE